MKEQFYIHVEIIFIVEECTIFVYRKNFEIMLVCGSILSLYKENYHLMARILSKEELQGMLHLAAARVIEFMS